MRSEHRSRRSRSGDLGSETAKNALCRIDATLSFTTDTPDFWRAKGRSIPEACGEIHGEPGYFHHVREALQGPPGNHEKADEGDRSYRSPYA